MKQKFHQDQMASQYPVDPMRLDRVKHAQLVEDLLWVFSDPAPGPHFQCQRDENIVLIKRFLIHVVPQIAMCEIVLGLRFETVILIRIGLLKKLS